MLILPVPIDLNKLFQDCRLTPITLLCESCRVMVMTIHFALVFVVTVLSAKDRWAQGAGEMFDVIFPFKGSDV